MGPSGGPITKDNTSVEYYGTIFALAESHHEAGVIWAGSDDGRVHLTRDGGETWDDVTPRGLPEWAQVNGLDIHPFEPGGAYLAATRYKLDDFEPYLFKTTDWGRSWTRITNGIPATYFTRAIRADKARPGLLYSGTEWGVFYSDDDGRNWEPLKLNLPIVSITDLAVKDNNLIAATQGRGFWILDDLAVLQQQTDAERRKAVHLYTPQAGHRLAAGGRADNPGNNGTNPYPGISLFYSLADDLPEDTPLSLEVFAAGTDEAIWTWTRKPGDGDDADEKHDDSPDTETLVAAAGLHRHVWDLRYPPMDRFDDLILWIDNREGPRAVPGTYRARLTAGDRIEEAEFEVLPDPRSTATADDYRAQFDFLVGIRDLLSETHNEITRLRALRGQLEAVKGRLDADEAAAPSELGTRLTEVIDTLTSIEEALYQTQNRSRQDPLNYPIRLNNKLSSLFQTVAMGDARPTDQAVAVRNELAAAVRRELEALEYVWTSSVPELNRMIDEAGLTLLTIPDAP
jgi:hypothetical protein